MPPVGRFARSRRRDFAAKTGVNGMTVEEVASVIRAELGDDVGIELRHIGDDIWDLYVEPPHRSPAFALMSYRNGDNDVRIIYSEGEEVVPFDEALVLLRRWAGDEYPKRDQRQLSRLARVASLARRRWQSRQ